MEDFSVLSLVEAKNEWCARLVTIFTPAVIEGLQSIFKEAIQLCENDDESSQYLMTFQTFLKRIPNWNPEIIAQERTRIEEESGCNYLEDLITCVHIIQLKALSCIRVSSTNKKVDIDIPPVDKFVHKVYIKCASKVYRNVYLYELEQEPLQVQKNNRELELLVREAILEAVRDTMPVEQLLKTYMAEQEAEIEDRIEQEDRIEHVSPPVDTVAATPNSLSIPRAPEKSINFALPRADPAPQPTAGSPLMKLQIPGVGDEVGELPKTTSDAADGKLKLKFDNLDYTMSDNGEKKVEVAPKTVARLEEISEERNKQRKLEEAEEDEEMTLKIGEEVKLEIENLNSSDRKKADPLLEIETLA